MNELAQRLIEIEESRGADAYLDGRASSDNPHDKKSAPKLHEAWNRGFNVEKNYWEGK